MLEQARRAFADGNDAEARGDCASAIERFEAAAAVKETAAIRLRIGRCREKLGQLRAALGEYERAKRLAESDPQARDVASQVAAELAARMPRLEVRVTDPPAGLVVTVDGGEFAIEGTAQAVDPGKHLVAARAPGFHPFEQTIEVGEGQTRAVTIVLSPTTGPEPPPPPPATPVESGSDFPWLPVSLYAVSGVAIGVAVPMFVTALADDAALDDRCFDESGDISEDRNPCLRSDGSSYSDAEKAEIGDERDSVITRQIIGWTLAGVGVAAAGVATVLLVTADGGAPADARGGVERVSPIAGPGVGGLLVEGRF
jgi:hypothetical protein